MKYIWIKDIHWVPLKVWDKVNLTFIDEVWVIKLWYFRTYHWWRHPYIRYWAYVSYISNGEEREEDIRGCRLIKIKLYKTILWVSFVMLVVLTLLISIMYSIQYNNIPSAINSIILIIYFDFILKKKR